MNPGLIAIKRPCQSCGRDFRQPPSAVLRTECTPCADLRAECAAESRAERNAAALERWERA